MAKAREKQTIQVKTGMLAVELTEKETKDMGKRLAALTGKLDAHGHKEKEVKDGLKGERSALEGEISKVAAIVNQGHEYRPVSIRVEADYGNNMVREYREDTGEIVGERALSEDERQASLDLALSPSVVMEGSRRRSKAEEEGVSP